MAFRTNLVFPCLRQHNLQKSMVPWHLCILGLPGKQITIKDKLWLLGLNETLGIQVIWKLVSGTTLINREFALVIYINLEMHLLSNFVEQNTLPGINGYIHRLSVNV